MKKLFLVSGIVLGVGIVAFFVFRGYTKSFSPAAVAEFKGDDLHIQVDYCQPSKKGRFIFGREVDGAVVPYGKVWRTGANEATLIKLNQDVLFAGRKLKAGSYSLWTIPGPAKWKVIVNHETGQWGTEYNDGQDLFRSEVDIRIESKVAERFTITFEPRQNGADMLLRWDQTEAIIPIRKP